MKWTSATQLGDSQKSRSHYLSTKPHAGVAYDFREHACVIAQVRNIAGLMSRHKKSAYAKGDTRSGAAYF